MVTLNERVLRDLITEADQKWFAKHHGQYDYKAHVTSIAGYVSLHYERRVNSENRKRPPEKK